jgi:hypothetical protein
MDAPALISQSHLLPGARVADASVDEAPPGSGWLSPSAWMSLLAGFSTLFTISFVGEMPVGELVLMATAGWAALCVAVNHAWPGRLLQSRFLWSLLIAQLIALGGYIFSDLYRHSFPLDMVRGWSRMVFLAIDVVAIAYLFGCARRNFLIFELGQGLGAVASALILGPLFGDMWKFGVGYPLTLLIFFIVPFAGPFATILAAGAMGTVHFLLDYRSLGGLCLLVGMLTFLQITPQRFRLWLAPLMMVASLGAVFWVYGQTQGDNTRATRSDVERSAMITAALEAFEQSPLIGHGSWFSNTDVYDNFMVIRHAEAKQAHVGGFVDPNKEPGAIAVHSQILVALAEGGLFGGAFFFVYGAGLFRALYDMVFVRRWHRLTPFCMLVLLSALWDLFCSPFSGAQRVSIAMVSGLILLVKMDAMNPSPATPSRA